MVSQAGSMAQPKPCCRSFACCSTRPNGRSTQRDRALQGDLRRLAGGPRPRRARPFAPVGARHLRARRDARDGTDRAVLGARGARRRELGGPPRARLGLPPPGQRALGARLRAARGRGAVTGTRDIAAVSRRDPVRGRRAGMVAAGWHAAEALAADGVEAGSSRCPGCARRGRRLAGRSRERRHRRHARTTTTSPAARATRCFAAPGRGGPEPRAQNRCHQHPEVGRQRRCVEGARLDAEGIAGAVRRRLGYDGVSRP